MILTLQSKSVTAQIDTLGAQLMSLKDAAGTEYMWQRDPKFWAKTSPFLFPIVGNLRDNKTVIDGKEYKMGKHGFCREAEFTVTAQSEDSVSLTYQADERTLAQYPYQFAVTLTFTLTEKGIVTRYAIKNAGDGNMLYCFGAHPGFNTPVDGDGTLEDCVIEFAQKETAAAIRYDLNALEFDKADRRPMLDNESVWEPKYSDFDNDAVVFDSIQSDSVKLVSKKTGHGVEVSFPGFDFIAFWTPIKANAPFMCIEPWCGMAACKDEDMNYASKYGVKTLAAGATDTYELGISML